MYCILIRVFLKVYSVNVNYKLFASVLHIVFWSTLVSQSYFGDDRGAAR